MVTLTRLQSNKTKPTCPSCLAYQLWQTYSFIALLILDYILLTALFTLNKH